MKKVYVQVTTQYGHNDHFLIDFEKVNTPKKLQHEVNKRYPNQLTSATIK